MAETSCAINEMNSLGLGATFPNIHDNNQYF